MLIFKICVVVAFVLLTLFFLCFLLARFVIFIGFGKREDYLPYIKYFKEDDFALKTFSFGFKGNQQQVIYAKKFFAKTKSKGVVVLAHGSGPGFYAYGNEINFFCQHGYDVITYDNTGCGKSQGKTKVGLPQSIIDLYCCLKHIEKENNKPIYLYGHSLGAYAVCNVTRLYKKNIKGIIALAPFNDPAQLIASHSLKFLKPFIAFWHKRMFGDIGRFTTAYSLEHSSIPTLIIYSSNDSQISFEDNFAKFSELAQCCDYPNKDHRPNISDRAVEYDRIRHQKMKEIRKNQKEELIEFFKGLDYQLLVEFDHMVMNEILDFIERGKNHEQK